MFFKETLNNNNFRNEEESKKETSRNQPNLQTVAYFNTTSMKKTPSHSEALSRENYLLLLSYAKLKKLNRENPEDTRSKDFINNLFHLFTYDERREILRNQSTDDLLAVKDSYTRFFSENDKIREKEMTLVDIIIKEKARDYLMLQGYAFMGSLVPDDSVFTKNSFVAKHVFRFDARINQKGLVIYSENKHLVKTVTYEPVLIQSKVEEFARYNDAHNKKFNLNEPQLKLIVKMFLEKNALLKSSPEVQESNILNSR